MQKIKPIISFAILVLLFLPLIVSSAPIKIENPLTYNTFHELIDRIIDFVFMIAIPITTIVILIAGYMFITAAGEAEKILTARKTIQWALIGLLVIICAKGLIALLGKVIGVQTPYN